MCHTTVGMTAVQGTGGLRSFKSCQVHFKAFLLIPYAVILERSQATSMDGLHCPYLQQQTTSGCVVGATLDGLCCLLDSTGWGRLTRRPTIICVELAIVHSIVGPIAEQCRNRRRDRLRVSKVRRWQQQRHQSSPGAMDRPVLEPSCSKTPAGLTRTPPVTPESDQKIPRLL